MNMYLTEKKRSFGSVSLSIGTFKGCVSTSSHTYGTLNVNRTFATTLFSIHQVDSKVSVLFFSYCCYHFAMRYRFFPLFFSTISTCVFHSKSIYLHCLWILCILGFFCCCCCCCWFFFSTFVVCASMFRLFACKQVHSSSYFHYIAKLVRRNTATYKYTVLPLLFSKCRHTSIVASDTMRYAIVVVFIVVVECCVVKLKRRQQKHIQ